MLDLHQKVRFSTSSICSAAKFISQVDGLEEVELGEAFIGTTKKGIG